MCLLTAIRIIKIMRGTIHGLAAQSADPCFAQRDPWIVQIHALRLRYVYPWQQIGETNNIYRVYSLQILSKSQDNTVLFISIALHVVNFLFTYRGFYTC